jgi:hypothetical protein
MSASCRVLCAAVLFAVRFHDGLADGSIDLTFRNWTRPQVKVGGRYRVGAVALVVDDIARVRAVDVSDDDARRCGFADGATMASTYKWAADTELFRIAFHAERVGPPPAPPALDDATIAARLAKLDAKSADGPWTAATLELIGRRPQVRAGDLAAELGRERLPFKADVRKLKRLGLTQSFEIGYALTDRGREYLNSIAGRR